MKRPSPALVISLIALFVALGGTSYAVTQIDANSVGTKQLKKGAVTSSKISKATRKALKGQKGDPGAQGAQGATGPQGPKGDNGTDGNDATTLWAVLNQDGTLRKGSGVVSVSGSPAGFAQVKFLQNIDTCAIIASIGRTGGGLSAGQVIADEFVANGFPKDTVLVQTEDSAGAGSGRGVHIAVFC